MAVPLRSLPPTPSSGAWQKYSDSWRYGIIWAECSKTLTKENPYDYDHFADCTCIPSRHAHGQTTCLRGAGRTPSDQSPASGAACQAPVGDGCWSQQQPDGTPDAPQPWDRVRVAPSLARPYPYAGTGGSGRTERYSTDHDDRGGRDRPPAPGGAGHLSRGTDRPDGRGGV